MVDHSNAPKLQGVLALLESKQKDPNNTDVETRFFNEGLEFLLLSDHWWCDQNILPIARESLWLFSLPEHNPILQYKKKLNNQLMTCTSCVQVYQNSKQFVKQRYEEQFPKSTVDDFFKTIEKFDIDRVSSSLTAQSEEFNMTTEIICAILEVICAPQMLEDCDGKFAKTFEAIQKAGSFPTFDTATAPYIVRMTLHHQRVVRFWARKLLEKFINTDQYSLNDADFLYIKDFIFGILQSFTSVGSFSRIEDYCQIEITHDLGEFWKAFRLIVGLSSPSMLTDSIAESSTTMLEVIQTQLGASVEWLGEILKTMTSMLLKMQTSFWGTISSDSAIYYDIIKKICEHQVFQSAMKIARGGNAGRILQRDGTPYPDDKLMAKIKNMLEWLYPFWSSLRATPVEKEITGRVLDTVFGYFQLDIWGIMSKAYCAELGLQVINQCLTDESLPMHKINEYIFKIIDFAKLDSASLPNLVKHMPNLAREILSDLLDKESMHLQKIFSTVYKIDDVMGEIAYDDAAVQDPESSPFEPIWISVKTCLNKDLTGSIWLASSILKAYGNIASFDIPNILSQDNDKYVIRRIADLHQSTSHVLKMLKATDQQSRETILASPDLLKSLIQLLKSPYPDIKSYIFELFQETSSELNQRRILEIMFKRFKPLKLIDAYNSMLREFISLLKCPTIDIFNLAPDTISFLSYQVDLVKSYVVNLSNMNEDEDGTIDEFWSVCWRALNTVLDKALQWATQYRPSTVVSLILSILDIATQLISTKQNFEKAMKASKNGGTVIISNDHLITIVDSLSHWIYVTRIELISKLVPLAINILNILKRAELKISVEAYDRLMTAATGVNTSKLSDKEREDLFMALSAHEPNNFIFLNDDSDDEDVEWQSITSVDANSPSTVSINNVSTTTPANKNVKKRQLTLDQSFSNVSIDSPPRPTSAPATAPLKDARISKYFAATAEEPHEISDSELEEEFADFDYSQVPDEWLQATTTSTTPTTVEKQTYFGQNGNMDIDTESQETIKETNKRSANAINITGSAKPKNTPSFYPSVNKVPTYAVTSRGRKLRPPSMGFPSKLKALRDQHRAERRLIATAKSPSAANILRKRYGHDSQDNSTDSSNSSDSDEGDDDSGLLGLIHDLDDTEASKHVELKNKKASAKAESASMKALFDTKPKRTIKLIATPISNPYLDRKMKAKTREIARQKKIAPNLDRLFKAVLSWEITETAREIPPNTNEHMYSKVPATFKSFEEYRSIFEPLLILETWCQLVRAKEQLSQNDILENCIVEGRCHTNDFVDVTFQLRMSLIMNNLTTDDLVCVANHFGPQFFQTDENVGSTWKGKAFLGKVMSINQKKNIGEVVVRCYFAADRISLLNSISPKTSWNILKIMSLTTGMREYAALEALEYYDLGMDIIQPKRTPLPKLDDSLIKQYCQRYYVNEPQAVAILSAMQKKNGFSLIQGPPGTGKTKTILALIVSLLEQRTSASTDHPFGASKLLVCAPSNAAVDEIAKRLNDGIVTSRGTLKPNVVRVGVSDSVNASVKDRILDKLIEDEMNSFDSDENGGGGTKWSAKLDEIHQDIRNIQIQLDQVDREITQSGSDMVQMSLLRDKRKTLAQKLTKARILLKDTHQDQKNYGREMEVSRIRARQKVLSNADVVCATLSGSGHDMLTSMGITFETVIVDEAAQSIEISSLIPLKFDTQRCILVGDPNQLPPTVMSPLAARFDYQQSLFLRLEYTMAKEVNLLSIQYRMHPDISRFPSKMFYQSRLLDGPDMAKMSSAVWHSQPEFPPYRFFNIMDGQEKIGRGKSIYNVAEADAAVALVDKLCARMPTVKFASRIGVITPYKQQVGQLKSRFQKRFGNNILDVIDFNTVDGFQGQEKEIIIFSCVRAGQGKGIGFLADKRRMNVGLTRAKCSLFVLGHAHSLSNSDYWGDLVRDAEQRSLIEDCKYPYFKHRLDGAPIPRNLFEKPLTSAKTAKPATPIRSGPVKITAPGIFDSFPSSSRSMRNSVTEDERMRTSNRKRPFTYTPEDPSARSNTRRKLDTMNDKDTIMTEAQEVASSSDSNKSFIEKVREQKLLSMKGEVAAGQVSNSATSLPSAANKRTIPPHKKLSLEEYRKARGLPPVAPSSRGRGPYPLPPRTSSRPAPDSSLFIKNRKWAAPLRPKPTRILPDGVSARERAMIQHKADREQMKKYREE
ncbi:hypothetical protein BDF20DRAFT_910411 [Mycotypha africana]|uniref:uncharacterized protein n=1 Tax=Mycotypha africana TaxID=64632 RepID=UPI002301B229|nr:uncharacterized protein BDF20DRAFT_910411 [Mycotypha africana]KAI8987866.1 hypothetical protein BDF20DRAFT_910411 [Mycotypha africana]